MAGRRIDRKKLLLGGKRHVVLQKLTTAVRFAMMVSKLRPEGASVVASAIPLPKIPRSFFAHSFYRINL